MKKTLRKIIDNYIYIFFGIYIITLFMNNTTFFLVNDIVKRSIKIIRYSIYLVFALKILCDWKKGDSVTIPMVVSVILSGVIFICSKNIDIAILVLTIIALRNCEFDKLIKLTFKIFIIMFFITVSLSLLKVIPDWTYSRDNLIRHSLGFYYPTITIGLYLSIILMYCYIKKSNSNYIELLTLETINVFLYSYTDGRLSFILITAILIIMAISKLKIFKMIFKTKVSQQILKVAVYILPVFLCLLTFTLAYMYSNQNVVAEELDTMLSRRLKYTSKAFDNYPVTLFGKDIKWNGWGGYGYVEDNNFEKMEYNYVDISYARVLFDYGIIAEILILYAYTKILSTNYKQKNYWMCIILFFVLIWAFVEPYIVYMGKNIFVLAFGTIINSGKKIKVLDYKYLKGRIKKENDKKITN